MFCEEVLSSNHFDMYLHDLAAVSVMRSPDYSSQVPYQGHIGVRIGQVNVRSGFYYAGVAVRKRRGKSPPRIQDRPPATSSSLEYANWLFGSRCTRCWPTKQDVQDLVRVKSLWQNPSELQTFALDELGILMDQKQWSSWVSTQLEDKRVSTVLNNRRYKQFFQSVTPSVVSTPSQTTSLPRVPCSQTTLIGASVNTATLMGPRKTNTTLNLHTSRVPSSHQVQVQLPLDPQNVSPPQLTTRKQKKLIT